MIYKVFVLFILLTISLYGKAQERIYNFIRYTINDGLPSDIVRDIEQDDNGLFWMTTSRGLCHFDGTRFVTIKMNTFYPNISNDLGDLSIDHQNHKIWISTFSHGLYCYDLTKNPEDALTVLDAEVGPEGLIKKELYAVHAATSGLIYFGGQETDLQIYNPKNQRTEVVHLGETSKYQTIFCINEDRKGNLWIGTRYGGIFKYNQKTKEICHIDLKLKGENGSAAFIFPNSDIYSTYYDQELVQINPKTNILSRLNILNWPSNTDFYDNSITALDYIPEEHKILIAHTSKGIYTYKIESGEIEQIDWPKIYPFDNIQGKINSFLVTNTGYYVASNLGLFYYSNYYNRISDLIPFDEGEPILDVFDAKDQIVYLTGSTIGLLDHNFRKRRTVSQLNGLRVSEVNVIADKVYLSTYNKGVFEYNMKSNAIAPLPIIGADYDFSRADCNTVISDIDEFGDEILWIGSWNSGLYRYHINSKTIKLFNESQGLINHKVITLGKDFLGRIWIGTDGFGLVLLANKSVVKFLNFYESTKSQLINSNTILSFFLDSKGNFWYTSSQTGVNQIIAIGQNFYFKNFSDHMQKDWPYIRKIKEDSYGNLWMKGIDGIFLFDTWNMDFHFLYAGEGIFPPKRYIVNSFYLNSNTLYWVTNRGFIKGNIQRNSNIFHTIRPIISQFKIMNRDESYQLFAEKLQLLPGEHSFTLYYSALGEIKDLVYSYKLEGIDKDWVIGDKYNQAHYTNISEGTYAFKLSVSDYNKSWSSKIISIPIQVQVEWYRTVWFKYVIALVFLSCIVVFVYYRINHHKKINKLQIIFNDTLKKRLEENEIRITAQNESLEIQRQEKLELDFNRKLYESELRAIRAQMNPHFIFNILNSIEAYIVDNDSDNASAMIQKFAKLSRKVLENSQVSIVSIQSELKLVELYMELERERFANKFHYLIEVENKALLKNRFIPSMLLQPIVENAIHHGIRNLRDKAGCILIQVLEVDTTIVINIYDNGVGLKMTKNEFVINPKSKSFGLRGVINRIDMINEQSVIKSATLRYTSHLEKSNYTTKITITLPSDYNM